MSLRLAVLAWPPSSSPPPAAPRAGSDLDQSRPARDADRDGSRGLGALRENFRTNQYYAANVSIDGEVVLQVGIRRAARGRAAARSRG